MKRLSLFALGLQENYEKGCDVILLKTYSEGTSVPVAESAADRVLSCASCCTASADTAIGLKSEDAGRRSACMEREAVRNIAKKQNIITAKVTSLITILFVIFISSSGISPETVFVFCQFIR